MAAPITHIVLADKFLKTSLDSKRDFFIGTSFPDIRYLGVIDRDKTHFINPAIEQIKEANNAKTGMIFHSFVDEKRYEFLMQNGMYQLIDMATTDRSLKLLEDEILYDKVSDWPTIASFMDTITPEELRYPINPGDIKRWHDVFKFYFSQKPTAETRRPLFKEIGFNDDQINKVENDINAMRPNEKIKEIIENLYNNFNF